MTQDATCGTTARRSYGRFSFMFAAAVPTWVWVAAVASVLLAIGKRNALREQAARRPSVSSSGFATVAGCAEAVEDLRELVTFLEAPATFERFGATVPKGALLVGPPGTGKTLLARAVAAEAGVPFLSANGSDFVEMYVGVGAKRIRDLYAEARSHTKAIVFIDELDAVARRRASGGAGDTGSNSAFEHENTLIALLTELDGFAPGDQVITIAATNRPEVLDPAVLRPGRIERRIEVPLPDAAARAAILSVHSANKPLAPEVSLSTVALRTAGMSGAELARVCNEAALYAIRTNRAQIDEYCFDAAVELIAVGRPRTSAVVSDRDRRITAWHEAGHATAALMLELVADPIAVSVVPRGSVGGVTWMGASDDKYVSNTQALAQLVVLLAGRVAEEMLLGGSCTQGASNDLERATELATQMTARFGMTERGLVVSAGDDDASRAMVDRLLTDAYRRCGELLETNRSLLAAIAAALCVQDQLSADELVVLRRLHATVTLPA